ncbi:uncharacterized protein A4U43_C01F24030 [Asparagus officinalis]|uniref:Uncharacterized protein n=1 Tax=Asparagus officinalis TaxID=4686 RepID=A0A5P1FVX1_ASPOF|nr:uncharacterized protein A4U43_C01F24030 [Asparagus officinalis]
MVTSEANPGAPPLPPRQRPLLLPPPPPPPLPIPPRHCVEDVDLSGESSVDAEWMAYSGQLRNLRILKLSYCRSLNILTFKN